MAYVIYGCNSLVRSNNHNTNGQTYSNDGQGSGGRLVFYGCEYCPREFPAEGQLVDHMVHVHGYGEADQAFNLTTYNKKNTGVQPFKCTVGGCHYAFSYENNLEDHYKNNHPEKSPFTCQWDGCNYVTSLDSDFYQHVNGHCLSLEKSPFTCQWHECDCVASLKHNLKLHIRTHTGEKPFKCEVEGCKYKASRIWVLKVHIRTHTGEKSYKCPHCSYACTQNGALHIHIRTHTGEKPYSCEVVLNVSLAKLA